MANKDKNTNIPACYLVLINDQNQILLSKRINTGYKDGEYGLVSGHVEKNESFKLAMIREAKEEANMVIYFEQLEMIHLMHRKIANEHRERVDMFLIAKQWEGEITNLEPEKCSELSWFDINNLPENTIDYVAIAIEKIKKNEYYSEIGF
jgi:ADP-ribose pyrophosphatase YjhB (NUDIX family)